MATTAAPDSMTVEQQRAALEKVFASPSVPACAASRPRRYRGWEEARAGLQPGDHVKVNRGIYNHHGIYVGDGMFVHKVAGASTLATASLSKAVSVIDAGGGLIYTGFDGFAPDPHEPLFVVAYAECFHPHDTVELAFSCLKLKDLYRLMDANCEHFATWCKTGRKESLQVMAVKNALFQSSAAVAAFTAGIAIFARLAFAEVVETTVSHIRGKGVGRLLGLGRQRITTTTVSVDRGKVYKSAAAAAAAGVLVYRVARRIKRWLVKRRKHHIAVRFADGDAGAILAAAGSATAQQPPGAEQRNIAVHKWRVRNARELLQQIQRELAGGASGRSSAPSLEDLLYFSPATGTFAPLSEEDVGRLPHVTSLKLLVRRPAA